MRLSYYLSSMLHLFVALFVMMTGFFIAALPFAPSLRAIIYQLVEEGAVECIYFGFGAILFSLCLLFLFWLLYRKKYVTFEMKNGKGQIDAAAVESYVGHYWKEHFQVRKSAIQVVVYSGNRIEIVTHKPLPLLNDAKELSRVESEISDLLARQLGIKSSFLLTVCQ